MRFLRLLPHLLALTLVINSLLATAQAPETTTSVSRLYFVNLTTLGVSRVISPLRVTYPCSTGSWRDETDDVTGLQLHTLNGVGARRWLAGLDLGVEQAPTVRAVGGALATVGLAGQVRVLPGKHTPVVGGNAGQAFTLPDGWGGQVTTGARYGASLGYRALTYAGTHAQLGLSYQWYRMREPGYDSGIGGAATREIIHYQLLTLYLGVEF